MTVEAAIRVANEAHAGQTDKTGQAYIFHPLRVAESVRQHLERQPCNLYTTDQYVQAAVLHDVIEDSDMKGAGLLRAGFDMTVVGAVQLLSKAEGESYVEFVQAAMSHPISRVVKYYDMLDNSSPLRLYKLDEETRNRLTKKYAAGLALYGGI